MAMKKIVSGALAAMMALSISATAFAADPSPVKILGESTESSFSIDLEGMIYTPTIRVQVTQAGSVYVNPTGSAIEGTMTKALDGTVDLDYSFACTDNGAVVASVASTPILVRSDTDKKLMVSATATATVPKSSGIELVAAKPTASEDAGKEVYLYVTGNAETPLGNSSALATTPASENTPAVPGLNKDKINLTSSTAASTSAAGVVKVDKVADDKKTATTTKAGKVALINAATQTKDATTGKVTQAVPQYGAVVVAGHVNTKNTDWKESDIVNVNVALTFGIVTE